MPVAPPADSPAPAITPGPPLAPVTLFVCVTCRDAAAPPEASSTGAPEASSTGAPEARRAGALLAASLGPLPEGIHLRPVECLANCKRGPSAAMTRAGGWSYVFGHLDPAADGPALLAGAALLAASPDGLMPWRGRPEALKRGMLARIPPLPETAA